MTDAGGGWLAHVDPATGATYYARGSDVRWERPSEASLTPKWQSRLDPATGATYYYNVATGETRWSLSPRAAWEEQPATEGGAEGGAPHEEDKGQPPRRRGRRRRPRPRM